MVRKIFVVLGLLLLAISCGKKSDDDESTTTSSTSLPTQISTNLK